VALVRAAVIPESWRRAWPTFATIGLVFPLVMGAGAAVSPDARAAWLTAEALTVFASNYVFVLPRHSWAALATSCGARRSGSIARRVGRYRLRPRSGRADGRGWLAWDLSLRRNVALKLLRGDAAAGSDAVQRFEREALAASHLQSRHVVQIFDYGASDDGLYYIAMEYLRGIDLEALVERHGPVPPARAVHFILQACLALEEAHGAGIIHRDIKPHNLFVTEADGDPDFVKLLDFGVVRLRTATPGELRLTGTGALLGTPVYLAPELWQGAAADERSDIYALGVTLYFLLTGRVSLGDAWPTQATPVPAALEALVRRCMAVRPEERVSSARDLRLALAEIHDRAAWTRADAAAFWRATGVGGAA
jgi:serine/threonine-protein kinase